jgi:serine/threonine-protein kinase
MSPEQARGEDVDWRSDIFAVGVMLFELTTGRRLFKGGTEYDTLKLIIERDYPRPSWVASGYPPALEAIVMRALEKDRDKRYQSAREMQADLEAFVRDEKLPVSSIALAEFMKSLFEEKLAAQKEALMQGRQLADIIASEINHTEHTMNTHTGATDSSARLSFTGLSTSGAGSVVESVPPVKKSGGGKWIALGAIGVVALLGIGALVFKDKLFPKPAPQTSAAVDTPAAKPKAKLVVKSDPPGAHISLNGEVRSEVTPAEIGDLPVGNVEVKVSMDGYASQRETIDLVADVATTRNFTLKKGSTSVQVDGAPKNATATLDGKMVTLPTFDASPGDDHVLVLSAPGMKDKTVKLNGDVGEVKKIDGSMDKAYVATGGGAVAQKPATDTGKKDPAPTGSGKISVSSSGGWCNAFVDGRALGPTPTGMIEVSAGNHSVSCVTESGKKLGSGAKVEAGGVARVFFTVTN